MFKTILTVLVLCGLTSVAGAQVIASDSASDAAYQPPFNAWANGDNGGFGFGAWTGVVDNYVGNSEVNGDGNNSEGFAPGVDIDTASQAPLTGTGASWVLRGDGSTNGFGEAIRPFSQGLQTGWTFRLDFDNGFVTNGNSVGFGLRSGTTNLFEFFFTGGNLSYTVAGSTQQFTTQGFTDDGMRTIFRLTSPTTYSFTVDFLGVGTVDQTFTGTLAAAGTIDNARLFDFSASGDPAGNAFYNSMEVAVPEPSTWVAAVVAVGGIVGIRVRRRKSQGLI
jgi:PEP-CTERM motif-containing protein